MLVFYNYITIYIYRHNVFPLQHNHEVEIVIKQINLRKSTTLDKT